MHKRLCVFGVVLLVLGAAGYGGARLAESRVEETAHWPTVPGRIVTSEVSTAVVKTGPVRRASDVANIRYAYSVNGRDFECDGLRVIPMLHVTPEGTPEELVRRYPVGRVVDVYYNPDDPGDALLTHVPAEDALRLVRSVAFLAPCVALVGLVIAGIAGTNLRSEPGRGHSAAGLDRSPAGPSASSTAAPVEPRATHWLVRGAAALLGLFLMLLGGPLSVHMACTPDPKVGAAVRVISLLIVVVGALLGAFLVCVGMRKPRRPPAVA